jgi:Cu/Ag efflux protein CusF
MRQRAYKAEGEEKMKLSGVSLGLISLMLSGCAAYEVQPLNINHPANPQAMPARERLLSKTLAYSRADLPAASSVAAQQEGHGGQHPAPQAESQKTVVVGEGKVVATVPSAGQLVVEHGEIKGFMEPMTMGYRIEPTSLLDGLKAGDRVRFTIDVQKKTIVKIEKLS